MKMPYQLPFIVPLFHRFRKWAMLFEGYFYLFFLFYCLSLDKYYESRYFYLCVDLCNS